MNLRTVLYMCICFGFMSQAFAQGEDKKKDSTNMYDKIETYSKKRKSTKLLHKLIFRSTKKKINTPSHQTNKQEFDSYNEKIVRNIIIKSHDPFGFSFTDSTETANSWLEKTGNAVHAKTKKFTIRNFLLFKKDEPFDALKAEESKRLMRSQNYIRSVEITVKDVENAKDSVDVFVEVLDSWSLIPKFNFSGKENTLRLRDRNFFGYGHQFDNSLTNRLSDGKNAYSFRYFIPNFQNTFINTAVGYNIDLNGFYGKYVNIDRPFYSPLAKWAAGMSFDEQYRQEPFLNTALEVNQQNFKYQSQDYWLGRAFKIFEGASEKERTTNLIGAVRLLNLNFKDAPSMEFDSIRYFSDETFYLGTLGISSRQFIKDSYIFRDGITEDVPVGTVYAITGGLEHKNQRDRVYLGARISHGNYFPWGYLSANFEYGTFINKGQTQQTAYSFQANYFTNLITLGDHWKMRQFVKPQFLIGADRLNSAADRITLDENNRFQGIYGDDEQRRNSAGIPGFRSEMNGTKKYVLSSQTQFYSPWEVLGFRLNPFVNFSAGILGEEGSRIDKSRFYSAFGVGFIIRNDYLVFSSFQLSFSYYPSIPGQGDHIFDTNSFETEDFGFQNFELGKPRPVWYN